MNPPIAKTLSKPRLLFILLALAAGAVGARPFAEAVGFDPIESYRNGSSWHRDAAEGIWLHIFCGTFIAVLACTFFEVLWRFFAVLTGWLLSCTTTLNVWVCITFMLCGTLCLLASATLAMHSGDDAAASIRSVSGSQIVMSGKIRLLPHTMAFLTLIIGCFLLGLGIWATFRPALPQKSIES